MGESCNSRAGPVLAQISRGGYEGKFTGGGRSIIRLSMRKEVHTCYYSGSAENGSWE